VDVDGLNIASAKTKWRYACDAMLLTNNKYNSANKPNSNFGGYYRWFPARAI